jgi:hypothetical protein
MTWSEQRIAAAAEVLREQRLHATVGMAGRQHAEVTVQHPGTVEAVVTVRIGRVLVYLHTTQAARRFSQVWQDSAADALLLAQRARRHPGPARPPDVAEPSMVVHVAGAPAATRRLIHAPGEERADHLAIRIDELRFDIYDQPAFRSCTQVFLTAERAAQEHLTRPAQPNAPVVAQLVVPIGPAVDNPAPAGSTQGSSQAYASTAASSPAATAAAALTRPARPTSPARRRPTALGLRPPGAGSPPRQPQPQPQPRRGHHT